MAGHLRRLDVVEQHVDEALLVGVGHHQIDAGQCAGLLGRKLRVTPGEHHGSARIEAVETTDELARLACGFAGYCAGVDDHDLGAVRRIDHGVAAPDK